jgi:hypothetical protein
MKNSRFVATIVVCVAAAASPLLAGDIVTLQSANGQYQLVVPKGWGPADFHVNDVQIGASYPHRGEYAEVVADRQEDYVGSLAQFAQAKRDTMAMSLDNPRLSPIQQIKMHGQDAFCFELHGQLPGSSLSVGYCVTVLATRTHYIQIIGWTKDSHFSENRDDLCSLADGFSEKADAEK